MSETCVECGDEYPLEELKKYPVGYLCEVCEDEFFERRKPMRTGNRCMK